MKTKMNLLYNSTTAHKKAKEYSRQDALNTKPCYSSISFYGDKDHWCAFYSQYTLTVLGPSIFWKRYNNITCTFKDGRLYGDITPFVKHICEIFNIDWLANEPWLLTNIITTRKDLWVDVLKGRITNPEDLCKRFSKKYFKGAYTYKTLKGIFAEKQSGNYIGLRDLWDFYYYTTDPNAAINRIKHADSEYDVLFKDMLRMCEIFNQKINPSWSMRRMEEEHQKQIELYNYEKIESCDDTVLAAFKPIDGINLLLTEKEACREGFKMHNCVHSCYWNQIARGEYLIANGNISSDYVDIGIRVIKDKDTYTFYLEQISKKYNKRVDDDVRKKAEEWVKNNTDALKEVIINIRKNPDIKESTTTIYDYIIPY